MGQAEICSVAFRPLVVVDQRPGEVAANIDAVIYRATHLVHMLAEIADFFLFALGADAVFRNHNRFAVAFGNGREHGVQALGIYEPAVLCVVRAELALGPEDEAAGGRDLGVVVIHADEVHRIGRAVKVVEILPLHHIVDKSGRVLQVAALPVWERVNAHHKSVGLFFMNDAGGFAEHANGDRGRLLERAGRNQQTGRPVAAEISDVEGAVGFVLRHPNPHIR